MAGIRQTPTEIVNEICMSTENIIYFIVEGESDVKFFLNRPFKRSIKIIVAYGWEKAEDVISISESRSIEHRIFVVLDRDYRDYIGCACKARTALTDNHSIESMMFWSNSFARIISEYGSKKKIKNKYGDVESLRRAILDICVPMGRYRIFSQKNNKRIKFKEIKYSKFIDKKTLSIDVDKFLDILNRQIANRTLIQKSDWENAQAESFSGIYNDPQFICHGHDLMTVTALSLQGASGSQSGSFDTEFIESIFRASYHDSELVETTMWKTIDTNL